MSWKMFWQIVLLIIIALLIKGTLNCGLRRYKCEKMGMDKTMHHKMPHGEL